MRYLSRSLEELYWRCILCHLLHLDNEGVCLFVCVFILKLSYRKMEMEMGNKQSRTENAQGLSLSLAWPGGLCTAT